MKIRRKKLVPKPEVKNFSYAVGFAKTPVHSRFKPGKSGNPKGRPRGSKNKNTILREVLSQKITVQQNGKALKMNKLTVIITTLVNKAIAGDLRAISTLCPLIKNMEETHETTAKISAEISVNDKEILDAYVKRSASTSQPSA